MDGSKAKALSAARDNYYANKKKFKTSFKIFNKCGEIFESAEKPRLIFSPNQHFKFVAALINRPIIDSFKDHDIFSFNNSPEHLSEVLSK